MKSSSIQVGKTYVNRGKGTTTRKVLAIGDEYRPDRWLGGGITLPPDEPGVLYEQSGQLARLYLSSFTHWVGHEA